MKNIDKSKIKALFNQYCYLLLFIILLIAFFSRLLYINFHELTPLQASIAEQHGEIAINVYKGYGYKIHPDLPETSSRSPLYILFLVGLWKIFGFNLYYGLVAQCVFDTLTTLMLFFLTTLIFQKKIIGLLAAFLWAIYIPEWNYVVNLYSEGMFALMLIFHFFFFIKALKKDNWFCYILSVIFLGLSTLTRPTSHLYIYLLWIPLLTVYRKDKLRVLSRYVVLFTVYFAVLSPWMMRNYALTGKLLITPPMLGSIYLLNNAFDEPTAEPRVRKIFKEAINNKYRDMLIHEKYSEVELSEIFWPEEKKYIINHFDKYFKNCMERFLNLLFNYGGWKNRAFTFKCLLFISANICFWSSVFITCFLCRDSFVLLTPIWCFMFFQVGGLSCLGYAPRYLLHIWPYLIMHFAYVLYMVTSRIYQSIVAPHTQKY